MSGIVLDLFAGIYTCTSCGGRYAAEDCFWRSPSTTNGTCRGCRAETRRAWYVRNAARALEDARRHRAANPDRVKDYHRKAKYGVPYGTYDRLLAEQGGGCGICSAPPGEKAHHVDHDHATGQVRGVLCDLCNRGLGYFADDAARLDAAAAYLRRTT